MSKAIPALDKSTSIEELLYMLGNREFLIYKHEKERERLYRRLSELELEVLEVKSERNGKLSNKSKRK